MEYESTQAKEPAVIETSFSEPTNERTPSAVEEPTGSESAAHMVRAITVGAGHTYCTYKRFVKYKYACVSYNTFEIVWICEIAGYAICSDSARIDQE